MRTLLALCIALFAATATAEPPIITVPLTLSLTNPYVWTNAMWWTNSTPQTNISTWQAWWAMNESLTQITNAMTTNLVSTNSFATTNAPSAGDALRWDGTNLYWSP